MVHYPPIVVSPPENQGSVLGRIVAGESCLELLVNIARWNALTRTMKEVAAELAALRARPYCDYLSLHKLSEFKPYRPYSKTTRKQLQNDEPLFEVKAQEELQQGTAFGYATGYALTIRYRQLQRATANDEGRKLEHLRAKNAELKADIDVFLDDLARRMGLDADWREVNVDQQIAARRPVVNRRQAEVTQECLPTNEHPITPYDVRWDALLRQKAFEERLASHINHCPTCTEYVPMSHVGTLEGGTSCKERAKKAKDRAAAIVKKVARRLVSPKHMQSRGRGPVGVNKAEDKIAVLRISFTERQRERRTLVMLMGRIFWWAKHKMRDLPKMADVDAREIVMGDLEHKKFDDAVRYLKARSRWLTEMRIEHKGGPEARSFNSILSESRLFPN